MKDRLEELRRRMHEDGDSLELGESFSFDNPVFQEDESSPMHKVLQEISSLSLALDKLEQSSESIAKKQQRVLCCTTEASIGEEKKELSTMKNMFTKEAKALQPRLGDIQETLAKKRAKSLAISRIRCCQFSVLVNRYREIITRHYAKETHYVGKLKEQIQRQTELAGLHLQEEDIKQLVESSTMPRIVGQDLEVLKAKQHLAMAQVRHQQLLDLEAQISELHSLFLHLEILVLEQQEVLNSIEYNILHTTDYICQSNEEVKKAIKYQRHSRLSTLLSTLLGLCACCTCLSCMATPSVLR
ncbi:PREDICTED: syntaxin-3-like [Thamnophis sirtalis]|uniref:Syntaxin-3-like n=1 Tax=Thamnophis sirtalis TaxID=35019 RepID=A0A6I9Y5D0_9SAUR|nr:PREDICTED: syntaxin-3-like [Thamnophis sirtalis]